MPSFYRRITAWQTISDTRHHLVSQLRMRPWLYSVLPTLGWRYIRYGGPPFSASLDSFSALIWRFRASISSGDGR